MDLTKKLKRFSTEILDPANQKVRVLYEDRAHALATNHQCSLRSIYLESLKLEIYPYRYLRNRNSISIHEQIKLAKTKVTIVGAGGLGGHIILLLARIGIGSLKIIDHDSFDETNLNRQAISSTASLGKSKAKTAVDLVKSINPAVVCTHLSEKIGCDYAQEVLNDSDIVVDALDNINARFDIEHATKKLRIPLVHGAVAGFEGWVMTIFPEDRGMENIYEKKQSINATHNSPESLLGVPPFTPAIIATLQAMEVIKIILNRGKTFRNAMAHMNLETGQLNEFKF